MARQTEQVLEEQLVAQLQKLGYAKVIIPDEQALVQNLKGQLEKQNNIQFSDKEFDKVLNILSKGSVFDKAHTLREKQHIVRDNGDNLYFEFINKEHWCQNQFQVTQQVTMQGKYENRYDVTLLINGLPLVQIELKRRGLELKEAFNQVTRYQKHSFSANYGLFQYIQIFIISNGVNTKYFPNFGSNTPDFKHSYYWTNKENKPLTNILNGFTDEFLEPCHISKMICKYVVQHETRKALMVLRPYQYYAVEAIVNKVIVVGAQTSEGTAKNGYIWHTTGSGKTLTSFKASQILTSLPIIKKVVFVVDRKDLDYQTSQEFNHFSKGSVDATAHTEDLIKKFTDPSVKLIVTTIQKLNNVTKEHNRNRMKALENERMVFIFDECHRSQFGDTHKNIISFFKNIQLFGFTGTPIFEDNAQGIQELKQTTKSLFGDCLHKYVITDAIKDENVLKFSVEYVGRYKEKDSSTQIDIEVEAIDSKELFEDISRVEKITDWIIANHDRKTHSRKFTAMFCVSSVDMLIKYYEVFRRKRENGLHALKIATIFSYGQNEDEMDMDDMGELETLSMAAEPQAEYKLAPHRREVLERYVQYYNADFGDAQHIKDTQGYYNYYNDISKKVRNKQVDILLVVNMFLTGFDSPALNTMYVDKNLKHHGLIQAYSRTNRTMGELKSQGNIVVFRNLKNATDEAIALFSNKEAVEDIIIQPYEVYVEKFNKGFIELLQITPTLNSVNELQTEEEELEFIKAFRELMRTKNILGSFADFDWQDLAMDEQLFTDYVSKYRDLYDKVKTSTQKEKVSVLNDVDFELDLIHRDEINVTYIINLLIRLKSSKNKDQDQVAKEITNLLNTESNLRSKRELIEKFIEENLPIIIESDHISDEFDKFWTKEQQSAFEQLVKEENLSPDRTERLIDNYLFSEREPLRDDVLDLIEGERPTLLQRKTIGERILSKIMKFVETFVDGMGR
jgi:type I restriction enzyme R subunit